MRLMIFVLLCICLFTDKHLYAQKITKMLDQYYKALQEDYEMNGNVAVSQKGHILYQKSFGFADAGTGELNTARSQFELASVSKLFTALAILQLKDKGLVNLDTSFQYYFPAFPYPGITVRHLLSHTSGLPDVETLIDSLLRNNPDKQFTIADELQNITLYSRTHILPFKPGDKWLYSSAGYHLLGILIEKESGQTVADYMQAHIFAPAGMKETYVQTAMVEKSQSNRVKNYQYNNHYAMKLQLMDTLSDWKEWTYNLALETAGSGIISTTGDMLRFDEALSKGILLRPETLHEAYTPYILNNGQAAQPFDLAYCGLGWFIFKDTTQGTLVWGSGANPGTISLFVRNLSRAQCFVVLHNVKCNPFNDINALGILSGQPVSYRASLGFLYARTLLVKGPEQARETLDQLLPDTIHYILRESDLNRASLEFRRAGLKEQALNTCREYVRCFPDSPDSYKDYAGTLTEYGYKEQAIAAYKKALTLRPTDEESIHALTGLSHSAE